MCQQQYFNFHSSLTYTNNPELDPGKYHKMKASAASEVLYRRDLGGGSLDGRGGLDDLSWSSVVIFESGGGFGRLMKFFQRASISPWCHPWMIITLEQLTTHKLEINLRTTLWSNLWHYGIMTDGGSERTGKSQDLTPIDGLLLLLGI